MGTELLDSKVNTHTNLLSRKLSPLGLQLSCAIIAADDMDCLCHAMEKSLKRSDLVIVTGGLGPTFDDITREAASAVTGRRLEFNKNVEKDLLGRYSKIGGSRLRSLSRQAMILKGARVLTNNKGTAPGEFLELQKHMSGSNAKVLVILPGPEAEMENTLEKALPLIKKHFKCPSLSTTVFKMVGVMEAEAEEKMKPLLKKLGSAGASVTILAYPYEVHLHITAAKTRAKKIFRSAGQALRKTFMENYLGEGDITLESAVGKLLTQRKMTLACAESCTGGLISERITRVSGSSRYFLEGAVTYSYQSKIRLLGVRRHTLIEYGAVSRETAREMADGMIRRAGADMAISVSGICGPTGATPTKPVGTARFGLAIKGMPTKAIGVKFSGDRTMLKTKFSSFALDLVRKYLQRK
ncbi:nicotinamide-nucleotide amidohydrolase family protein [Elusimicrobiota bacterium]